MTAEGGGDAPSAEQREAAGEGHATDQREAGGDADVTPGVTVDSGEDPSAGVGRAASDPAEGEESDRAAYPSQAPPSDEFGREGWVVVGVLVFSFLIVPPAIIYLPEAQGLVRSLGLTLRDAYLALPMLPAVLLGAVAVWAALRHRRR